MVRGKYTLKNYRCFNSDSPASIDIADGFTSFIGPNNAGKSALIKSFYELRGIFKHSSGFMSSNPHNFVNNREMSLDLPLPVLDPFELVNDHSGEGFEIELEIASDEFCFKKLHWKYSPENRRVLGNIYLSDGELVKKDFFNSSSVLDSNYFEYRKKKVEYKTICELVRDVSNIQYLGPFRNAINEGSGSYYDLGIGTAFINQWHQWKTGSSRQQNRDIINVTNDIKRLIGAKTLEISASVELKAIQAVIDGKPYKLSELGSGIAQLIIVLGNCLINKPSYIAIDEPETNLHPGLQLDFMTSLATYARNGILFTTHSIGLAKSISDRTYSVQKIENGSVVCPFDRTPRYAEFLGSLGITGLKEFGWDTILLVEGPQEVRSFQQILRKYKLDRKVVILPLGGSSMINGNTTEHLAEVVKIGKKVFAVVDSERKSEQERVKRHIQKFKENCELLKIKCLITERRATENYITESAIKDVYGVGKYATLAPYDAPPLLPNAFWGKSENWRLFQAMTKVELDNTDIGEFVRSISPARK